MERITVRIPEKQLDDVEELVESGEYPNRSEAIREAVRNMLAEKENNEKTTGSSRKPFNNV